MKWGEQKKQKQTINAFSTLYTGKNQVWEEGGQANKISKTLLWFETNSGSYHFAFYFIIKIN